MKGVRVLVVVWGLLLVLVAVGGCGSRWTSDTDGIAFLITRPWGAGLLPTLTISNTASVSLEVMGIEDMLIYYKEHEGWVRWGPCSLLSIYDTEKKTIPPGDSWQIPSDFYTTKTCVLDDDDVGTYMASIRYRISGSPRNTPPLTLYSDEFRMGDEEDIASFTVTVEQPSFSGFRLRNTSDQPLWFNPPCSRVSMPYWFSVSSLLQRQIDTNAWESFYPDAERCTEEVEPTRIAPGATVNIEAEVPAGRRGDFSPGQYRWEVTIVIDCDEDGELTPVDTRDMFSHRHIFSPIFEYDSASATTVP